MRLMNMNGAIHAVTCRKVDMSIVSQARLGPGTNRGTERIGKVSSQFRGIHHNSLALSVKDERI